MTQDDNYDRGNPLAAEMTEEEIASEFYDRSEPLTEQELILRETRQASIARTDQWWRRAIRMWLQYDGNKAMAFDCLLLATCNEDMISTLSGAPMLKPNAVEVAVKHFGDRKKKAAVSKVVAMFRDCLEIKNAPGQRGEKGRVEMTKARKNQLKTK